MEEKNNFLFQEERRKEILELLKKEGKIWVTELSKYFKVSGATIRTDLNEMEQDGLLLRTHGGAIEKNKTREDAPLDARQFKRFEQKKAIAVKAIELISDGDTLTVDGGTTLFQFISELSNSNKSNLTVITNFVPHIDVLKNSENIKTIFVGGQYDKELRATIGSSAVDVLLTYRTDKVIMSATGISIEDGITYAQEQDAGVKRTMLNQGRTRILLTDSSKIGKSFFASAGRLNTVNILVTDWEVTEETVKAIENIGIKVIVAPRLN